MIVLRANTELKSTFEKLIKTMEVNVSWNGLFVVIDNCLILQGAVRSLFFHFDSRKVLENIIELPIKEDAIIDTEGQPKVWDVINMILYSFGKWGAIKGLRVEKNHEQLNRLFSSVLREINIEPEYNWEHFQFYQDGIRVTYEDVVQAALESEDKLPEEESEEEAGLWHKVAWKKAAVTFEREDTTLEERRMGRLGNNFYRIGYLCPDCGEKLHMVVYPIGAEFKIETPDGAVLLARACTCAHCNSFFTPRPEKMLSEGDIYRLDFDDDRKAYEDYLELLGKKGQRVSSYRYNLFADGHRENTIAEQEQDAVDESEQSLEEACENLEDYNETQLQDLSDKIEEGFFPEESIERCEKKVREQLWKRGLSANREKRAKKERKDPSQRESRKRDESREVTQKIEKDGVAHPSTDRQDEAKRAGSGQKATQDAAQQKTAQDAAQLESGQKTNTVKADETRKKYEARFQVLDRLSDRQLTELKNQVSKEPDLSEAEKQEYIGRIVGRQHEQKAEVIRKKIESSQGKNYAVLKRVYEEVKKEDLPETRKAELLEPLRERMQRQAEAEVKVLMEKMPPQLDRARFQAYEARIRDYEEADLTPYEELLKDRRLAAERQEVANIVNRARKSTRSDLTELMDKLKNGNYLQETVNAYLEKLEERLRKMDQDAVDELLGDPLHMDFEEGQQAYETIANGDFLPEIKDNALKMLTKRLSKIKSDECELLVKKMQDEFAESGVTLNDRHHFYPARKVLLKQALPEETSIIDAAMATYAAGKGLFEYPILVVDTSRSGNGKEGFILTPEHLFYSTMMTSFGMRIFSIDKITASTGILNRGLYIHQSGGTKTKIPYAVDHKDLAAFAKELDAFVHYLQEKPDSRKVAYLAKEKHDTICCYRCGYVYKGGTVCPKCGFKNNE